ncbi:sugar phosphate isomerase/epimerase family protein [Jiulongibacter sp. NS-SX5]|uniref:sugar phosphate isomerase/epimerase family protein n=1 Tax=Jiulongibacter sp. NS-SX5 TaxID=3463854 RepID=UPI00405824C8
MKSKLSLAAALLALMVAACTSSESEEKTVETGLYDAEFGVQAYTFRHQFSDSTWTTEAILDTIVALGFTEYETGAPRGIDPETYKQMCADRGLTIVSTGAGFEQLENNPMEVVEQAKALGADFIMCAWVPHSEGFHFEEAKKAVEVFNAAGKVISENGLTFCYHPHGYEFGPNPEGEGNLLDYIIQNTDAEHVSFELDVLWAMHGGGSNSPQELLQKYGDRFKLMHVKDLKKGIVGDGTGLTPAENDVVLGTGQANWPEILKLAKEVGIKHYFIEDESDHEFEHIPKSLDYLRSL